LISSINSVTAERAIKDEAMKLRSFQMRILLWTWGLLLMAMAVVFFYSTSIVGDELVTEA